MQKEGDVAATDAEFEAMFDLFYPRCHWSTPSFWVCDKRERTRAIYLLALLKNDLIERISDRAAIEDCEGFYRRRPEWSESKSRMHRKCASRRGNDDLKSQSWSAYLEMQRRDPEGDVLILDSPCFLVFSERQQSVIVPGNGSHIQLTRFVAANRIKTLFFVAGVADEDSVEECEFWQLEGLRFSDRSLDLISEMEAKEQAELDQAMTDASCAMNERLSQIISAIDVDRLAGRKK